MCQDSKTLPDAIIAFFINGSILKGNVVVMRQCIFVFLMCSFFKVTKDLPVFYHPFTISPVESKARIFEHCQPRAFLENLSLFLLSRIAFLAFVICALSTWNIIKTITVFISKDILSSSFTSYFFKYFNRPLKSSCSSQVKVA